LQSQSLASYLREVREEADAARVHPMPVLPGNGRAAFLRSGDRLGFERPYFERRRALVALALASWLWRDAADIRALENCIAAICGEERWALSAHDEEIDLFACETASALAEIGSCLGGDLDSSVVERAEHEVGRRVLVPFLERRGEWAWERMRNNWCAVCAGSIGAAAIYLIDDADELNAVLTRIEPTLSRYIESFPDDGACLEGLGYWTYGFGFFTAYADLLYRYSGGRCNLLAGAKIERIASFQSKAYLSDSLPVAFADSSAHERYRRGLARFLAGRFPDAPVPSPASEASFRDDECGRWCLSFRDLIWSVENEGRRAASDLKAADLCGAPALVSWFPTSQWLICRASSSRSLGFAAKGGNNDEPHNHNDLGSFQLAVDDCQFIAELGAGEYTRDYFGAARYTILCNSSFGHSVPIVEGRGQEPGPGRRAERVECEVGAKSVRLSMDLAAAYAEPRLRRLERSFDFDGSRNLALRDEFEFDGASRGVVERFITGLPEAAIRIEGAKAVLEAEKGKLYITCSAPNTAPRLVLLDHRSHDGSRIDVACLDYELPRICGAASIEFEFRLSV
jgi:hypothetical protein